MSYSTQQNPGIISNVQSNVGSFGEEMKKKVFGLGILKFNSLMYLPIIL